MRKRSLETFKDSAKRTANEQQGARLNKSGASGPNTLAYLKNRAEVEATLKSSELDIKGQELTLQAKEQERRQQQFDMMSKQTRVIQQLRQQQIQQFIQMNANMMQQHQQQTLALMPGGGGGVLPEKLGGDVRPASQNPYPVYDQNLRNSLPYL